MHRTFNDVTQKWHKLLQLRLHWVELGHIAEPRYKFIYTYIFYFLFFSYYQVLNWGKTLIVYLTERGYSNTAELMKINKHIGEKQQEFAEDT